LKRRSTTWGITFGRDTGTPSDVLPDTFGETDPLDSSYVDKYEDGMRVVYNSKGYPNFSRYLYDGADGLSQVRIPLTGTRAGDFAAANRAAGFTRTPRGYTWHHHEDVGLMQLIRTRVHSQFWHTGGFSLGR